MDRGAVAATTWIFSGNESRRRGHDVETQRRQVARLRYVAAPRLYDLLLGWPRPVLATSVLRLALRFGLAGAITKRDFRARHDYEPHDAATERDTGLPRTDDGKRAYFDTFGAAGRAMQGWDRPLAGALALVAPYVSDEKAVEWDLIVGQAHVNTFGALHGGCAASLVDVLGSAVVAMGDPYECGVAVALDVQYAAPARKGQVLRWTAKVARRGGRLVIVSVAAVIAKTGRAVVSGSVTKSMRGLKKAAGSGKT